MPMHRGPQHDSYATGRGREGEKEGRADGKTREGSLEQGRRLAKAGPDEC